MEWLKMYFNETGLSTLFRLNTFLAIPFILVIFLLQYGKKRGLLIRSSLLFLLGIFIALAPWMTHNAVKYDDPIRFIKGKIWVINRRFRKTSNLDMDGSFETITFFPEQLISTINRDYQSAEYSSSNSDQFDLENNHLTGTDSTVNGYLHPKYLMASSFLAHINDFKTGKYSQEFFNEVGGIIKSILRHFLNNLVTSFSILPVSAAPQDLFHGSRTQQFWGDFDSDLYLGIEIAVVIFNLILLALGLAQTISKNKVIGLIPVAVYLGYHFSNGIAISSGNRYTQPASWMVFLYYGVGLLTISNWFINKLNPDEKYGFIDIDQQGLEKKPRSKSLIGLLSIISIFVMGFSPVIADIVPPQRYENLDIDSIFLILNRSPDCRESFKQMGFESVDEINQFFSSKKYDWDVGKINIPLFINASEYEYIYPKSKKIIDYNNSFLTFLFQGNKNTWPRQLYYFPGDQLGEIQAGMDAVVVYNKSQDVEILITISSRQKLVITNENLENFNFECFFSTNN